MSHLALLIVKARVLDLESVPQHIILSDAEEFQGESWTVQCEIINDDLLGGLPPDEDPLPDDPPNLDAPFDFFGHGPAEEEDANAQDHDLQNVNLALGGEAAAGWEPWPAMQEAQPINQNQEQGLDLNARPVDGEIINPGIGANAEGEIVMGEAFIELNDLVPNVIEEQLDLNMAAPEEPPALPVDMPIIVQGLQVASPENWLAEEIPEDMLMDDAELALEAAIDAAPAPEPEHPQLQNNIHLGKVEIFEEHVIDPSHATLFATNASVTQNAEAVRLWARFFKDSINNHPTVKVHPHLCNFFTFLLLSPTHFSWASDFLQSKAWQFFSATLELFSSPCHLPAPSRLSYLVLLFIQTEKEKMY